MMNTKRWVALGVAAVVLLFSIMVQVVQWASPNKEQSTSFWDTLLADELFEDVLEKGSFSERIAVMRVNGAIIDDNPSFLSTETYHHQTFLMQLEEIANDSTVKGVILVVNSPGGGVYESAQIKEQLDQLQDEHDLPIYASFGSMAASGGYYISAGADRIFATKETLTGSLGVIMSSFEVSELMENIGVGEETITSGEYKDIGSFTRKMTDAEIEILQELIDRSYDDFVDLIVEGRNMSEEDVRQIADGRIYDGGQAQENGLVDELGNFDDAVSAMKENHDLEGAQVFSYSVPVRFGSWFEITAQDFFRSNIFGRDYLAETANLNRGPRLMYMYGEW